MEKYLFKLSNEIIEAYNASNELELRNSAKELNKLIKRTPTLFTKNKHPLLVFIALYRALGVGVLEGSESLLTGYYCMMRSFLEKEGIEKIEAAMYGFLFMDANMGILQVILGDKMGDPQAAQHILFQQLSVLYVTFNNKTALVKLGDSTSWCLSNRKKMYEDIANFNVPTLLILDVENRMKKFCNNLEEDMRDKEEREFDKFLGEFDVDKFINEPDV